MCDRLTPRKEIATSNSSQSKLNAIMSGKKGKAFGTEGNVSDQTGTSIFDPVLCELIYRWFCPSGGLVLDPFAGGSVRGVVAAVLNRRYFGIELRPEQVEANIIQWNDIKQKLSDVVYDPNWIVDDSRNILNHSEIIGKADCLFSCPPYADLEVYSDDPLDLSTLSYQEFKDVYADIIKKSCSLLGDDSFACFIVGEVRGKDGNYYNFVSDTIKAFVDAGLHYYNEAILVTACGSLPIRAGKQFTSSRKLGKTHQNVLIFLKGDFRKAVAKIGDVEFGELSFDDEGSQFEDDQFEDAFEEQL